MSQVDVEARRRRRRRRRRASVGLGCAKYSISRRAVRRATVFLPVGVAVREDDVDDGVDLGRALAVGRRSRRAAGPKPPRGLEDDLRAALAGNSSLKSCWSSSKYGDVLVVVAPAGEGARDLDDVVLRRSWRRRRVLDAEREELHAARARSSRSGCSLSVPDGVEELHHRRVVVDRLHEGLEVALAPWRAAAGSASPSACASTATFEMPVAKWSCQKSTSFSCSGVFVFSM